MTAFGEDDLGRRQATVATGVTHTSRVAQPTSRNSATVNDDACCLRRDRAKLTPTDAGDAV
jgi:hypothetical protein